MAASTASQIIEAIGGAGNVKSLTHCATRLRFELVDAGKVDQHRLETMKGVLGAVPQSGDRYQVVIGGAVATMYENIMHLPEMAGVGAGKGAVAGDKAQSDADVKAAERAKVRGKVAWMDSFFEYLSDSFRPILGVLLGASIIIALINLCISIGIVPGEEANTSPGVHQGHLEGRVLLPADHDCLQRLEEAQGRPVARWLHYGCSDDPAVRRP